MCTKILRFYIIPGGYFSPDFWFTINRITIHHLCCSTFFVGRPEGIACTLLVLNWHRSKPHKSSVLQVFAPGEIADQMVEPPRVSRLVVLISVNIWNHEISTSVDVFYHPFQVPSFTWLPTSTQRKNPTQWEKSWKLWRQVSSSWTSWFNQSDPCYLQTLGWSPTNHSKGSRFHSPSQKITQRIARLTRTTLKKKLSLAFSKLVSC